MKDWIARGGYPLYSLRVWSSAQSGPFSPGHPIVEECGRKTPEESDDGGLIGDLPGFLPGLREGYSPLFT